jgi:hypothetical protein
MASDDAGAAAKFVRKRYVHGVHAAVAIANLYLPEELQHHLLAVHSEGHIGHTEENIILLENVLAKEHDVASQAGIERGQRMWLACGGTLNCGGHRRNEFAAQLVLVNHAAEGAVFARYTCRLQRWKERVLFLGVMTGVREVAQELYGLPEELRINGRAVEHALGSVQDRFDDTVLSHKHIGGAYGR